MYTLENTNAINFSSINFRPKSRNTDKKTSSFAQRDLIGVK